MNGLIHLRIIFRLCCCYSVSQDIYDWENQNENMDLEQKMVHHAKWKVVFFLESKSCLPAMDALGFLHKKQASCCSAEDYRKNILKEHKPSSTPHCQREYIQSTRVENWSEGTSKKKPLKVRLLFSLARSKGEKNGLLGHRLRKGWKCLREVMILSFVQSYEFCLLYKDNLILLKQW